MTIRSRPYRPRSDDGRTKLEPTELPLRDLHLPDAVGWWPLAPGWWALLLLLFLFLVWYSLRAVRRYRAAAPRRFALGELRRIEDEYRAQPDPVRLAQQVSELLRRAMLAYAPRQQIAGLTGDAWLEWLDRDLSVPYFHTEGGKTLLHLPYKNPKGDFSSIDTGALLSAARLRLSTPVRGAR